MIAIKKRFIFCLVGTVLCAVVSVWFLFGETFYIAILFTTVTVILIYFTLIMSERYQSARLICENPILNVGVASVSKTGDVRSESTVNVVVSGFGILMDGKPYKFGHGGVSLTATTIDRESITLFFGSEEKKYSIRLLHGIADKTEVDRLTEQLRYETSVVAEISGW